MIKATITPSTGIIAGQLFRHATLTIDDKPVLDLEWQIGFKRPGLTLSENPSGKTLATTTTTKRLFPPRTYFHLDVVGSPLEVPKATIHYRWFTPRLQLGDQHFAPQMMRVDDEPYLTFETEHWGFHVIDHETALHLQVATENLLLPIAFTAYFTWTYHSVGRS